MNYTFFSETFPWLAPMGQYFAAIFLVLFIAVSVVALESRQWGKQKIAMEYWQFDATYTRELLLKYPHLGEADVAEAFEQLRLYFQLCWRYEKRLVAMPSKLVDDVGMCLSVIRATMRGFVRMFWGGFCIMNCLAALNYKKCLLMLAICDRC